jgi:hypothetical protein
LLRLCLPPSNSSPVWTGLAHSLTASPGSSIPENGLCRRIPPLSKNGAAWGQLRQMGLPATTQSWQESSGAFEHVSEKNP